jgi:hypothetical protein
MAQWAAAAKVALQHGATSVRADESTHVTQEKAAIEAEAAKEQGTGAAMIGGASTVETDEAIMARVDEVEVAESSREATVVDAGKVVAEMASALP